MQRSRIKNRHYCLAALTLLLAAATAFGQGGNTLTLRFPGVPTGGCAPIMLAVNNTTGNLYNCTFAGTWQLIGGGGAGITTLNGLLADPQFFGVPGTAGTAPAWTSAVATHTLNIPLASVALVTAGLLSNADYATFAAKQAPISVTAPITLGGGTSVGMVNVGTTTTVLHGNAAGNAAFSGVSLTADATVNQGTTTTLLHGNAAGSPAFGSVVSADLNITGTTCTNQFVSAISSAAAGTCTTATLSGAQFANQGTTTTVLHGNGAGNPSFAAVTSGDVDGTVLTTSTTATGISGPNFCADAGASDTYACNLSPVIASYVTGTHYWFKANTANTLAASINFNSKGALTIKKLTAGSLTTDLDTNDIRAGQWVEVVYDGTNAEMWSPTNNIKSVVEGGTGAAPTNDDYVLVADSATAATWRAVPNCVDASGYHLNYTTATNLFSCGTTGAAGAWNSITAANGAMSLANTSYASTFTQTSAVNWSWNNITAATAGTAQSSPILNLGGRTWHGGGDTADKWAIQNIVTDGTDGASTLTFTHTGSSGAAAVSFPGVNTVGAGAGGWAFLQGAAQTAPANTVGWQAPAAVANAFFTTMWAAPATGLIHVTNATPSVASVSAVAVLDVVAVLKTRAITFILGADNGAVLADADDQATIFRNTLGQGVTITEVWCECDGGTPRIQLQRDDGSPANILTDNAGAGMDCAAAGATGTLDGTEEHIASTNRIDFVMVTAGGVAKRITLAITYTLDP